MTFVKILGSVRFHVVAVVLVEILDEALHRHTHALTHFLFGGRDKCKEIIK